MSVHHCLICVLGYGSRLPDREQLLQLANAPECMRVLIFWNQPSSDVATRLQALARDSPKIEVRTSPRNTGSAGGYSTLLQWASAENGWEHALLLDDDLSLDRTSLSNLLQYATQRPDKAPRTLYMAYRRDLSELFSLVELGKPLVDIRPGACLGFHVLNAVGLRAAHSSIVGSEGIRLNAAPYGGLLIPRPALRRLGKPMESLFLYADDAELTLRFTQGGGDIYLVPKAVVADRSPSWNATATRGGNMIRRILHMNDTKAYFEARNRNYLSRRFYPGHWLTYRLNKMVFLFALYVLAATVLRVGRARLIHRAINEGESMTAQGPTGQSIHLT